MKQKFALGALTVLGVAGFAAAAEAQSGELTLYCALQPEWCQAMATAFEAETGITVNMTRKSSGETYAQLLAEASNPRGDVWWGGTGDPHLQAAEEGLTMEYQSPMLEQLQPWAVSQAEASGYRTVGIYAGALGFGYNTEWLEANDLEAPACWSDLVEEQYRGEIQIANPNSSGTAYTALSTFVQLMGEEEAFEYMRALNENVNEYTQSGSAPIKAAARGETGIGIVFMHDAVQQAVEGFPIEVVAPCEGTGYEIGSMSIVKGAPNLENAKIWYDWALSPEAQSIAATVNAFQVPSNVNAETPPEAPDLDSIKLIDYDFETYGSSEERTRLLSKWDEEIGSLPH
ncbi:ABC transporter substrate-binding protein [Inquilinus sp. CAU 1745]|uniref:ABC transporter substrate-binding protein n=1 Tax=Inquilinus sp. CAU 1745 TaxID=3140369 RepID=UPI00325BDCFE